MAVELKKFAHPDYLKYVHDYRMIRDCYDGERAVKDAGTTYLPALKGQPDSDYLNYKTRALFFPITGKTATTMVGLATVKPPKTVYPPNLKRYFADTEIDQQFTEFYVKSFLEVLLMGRYGVLIDAPNVDGSQPKFSCYRAENVVRWEVDDYGLPTSLLLKEHYHVSGEQRFEMVEKCRYRHCYLLNGVYTVETLDEDLVQMNSPVQPEFSGETIKFIPFVCFGSSGVHMSVDRPPMLDIATINISHYLTSADLEWGRHITGLPTPVVSGVDSSTKLSIGGTSAWILPTPEAKAYYLEFTGQGLGSLEKAMTDKIGLMASVSARLIDNSTRGSEAAETVRLRYMSESASLTHSIGAVESGMNILYNMLAKLSKESEVTVLFSREIVGTGIAFKDLKTLFEGYFEGGISKETLLYNLRRLEAVDPNRSDADELAAIRAPRPQQPPAAN
jgi:hypothetical protein